MDAKHLSWNELQVFLAAARGGSLSAAADALDSSAATVMRHLRDLEQALGAKVFTRSPRGYALTPEGRELLQYVERMEDQVLAAQRRVSGSDQRLAGSIRVATVDDLVTTVLAPVLASFADRHPDVCLDLLVGQEHTNLAERQADVAIRAGARPATGDVVAKRVGAIGVALYASQAYLQAHPRPALQHLRGHRTVRADEGRRGLAMERTLDRHGAPEVAAVRSNSMLARAVAVHQGLGVGLLPCFLADSYPGLVRLGDVVPEASAELWILMHPDLRRNARVRAFVDHVAEQLRAVQGCLAGTA